MKFVPTILQGSYVVNLSDFRDERGWFMRTFCKHEFEAIGHDAEWVQMNHSYTASRGSIRGMHFQKAPSAEIKLVRCIRGRVYDVIIDLRRGSATFLKWFAVELAPESLNMLYVPMGFAHGFQTLEDNSELIYCHSAYYNKETEAAVRYDDPMIQVTWPLAVTDISVRDANHPLLTDNFQGI